MPNAVKLFFWRGATMRLQKRNWHSNISSLSFTSNSPSKHVRSFRYKTSSLGSPCRHLVRSPRIVARTNIRWHSLIIIIATQIVDIFNLILSLIICWLWCRLFISSSKTKKSHESEEKWVSHLKKLLVCMWKWRPQQQQCEPVGKLRIHFKELVRLYHKR